MKVLVTGATGRIGSRLARRLLERGHEVRTVVLPDDPNADLPASMDVECLSGDLTSFDMTLRAADGVDAVFHLAALMAFFPSDSPRLFEANIRGTYNLLEAAMQRAKRPLRLVFASSDQVYPGPFAMYRPTDETHPRLPITFYGLTKVIGEDMFHFYGRTVQGVHVTVARFTHTEAPEELIDPHGFFARRLFFVNGRLNYLKESGSSDPKVLATIETLKGLAAPDEPLLLPYDRNGQPFYQELTHVEDIVQGLLLILDRPEAVGETFNLTPPAVTSLAELIPYMAAATGRRYVEAQLAIDAPKCHASGAKARALLGYNPRFTMFDMIDEAVGGASTSSAG